MEGGGAESIESSFLTFPVIGGEAVEDFGEGEDEDRGEEAERGATAAAAATVAAGAAKERKRSALPPLIAISDLDKSVVASCGR